MVQKNILKYVRSVSRLNKTESFKDVKILSFDLRTATLQYAPGYNASITYSPTDDSYRITFFLSSPFSDIDRNPHELLAPLLSAKLNELTSAGIVGETKPKGQVGREFMGLLKNTLPVLKIGKILETKMGWGMAVLGVAKYRLIKDHDGKRLVIMFIVASWNRADCGVDSQWMSHFYLIWSITLSKTGRPLEVQITS